MHPLNEEAHRVFCLCADQLIYSFEGPVSMDIRAVIAAMELLTVDDKVDCLRRVKSLSSQAIDMAASHRAARTAAGKSPAKSLTGSVR